MGCVYSSNRTFFRRSKSKPNQMIGSHHRHNNNNRIFNVINVDGQGNEINYGQIEITDADLILHQRAKNSIYWPLRSLRRYGFDSELFSFECGRRCPTGPGIYAFKCGQAEQLFNVLQESVQRCSNTTLPPNFLANLPNHITSPQHMSGLVPISSTPSASSTLPHPGPRLSAGRLSNPPHTYANDVHEYMNAPRYVNTLKRSSLSSSDDVPPLANGPPVRLSGHVEFMSGTTDINTNYAKLDDLVRYYVNINTPCLQMQQSQDCSTSGSRNLNTVDNQSNSSQMNSPEIRAEVREEKNRPPPLPTEEPINYIVLDLDQGPCNSPTYVTTAPVTPVSKTPKNGELNFSSDSQWNTPPPTPTCSTSSFQAPQQYATIDFDKTVALSNSVANHRKL